MRLAHWQASDRFITGISFPIGRRVELRRFIAPLFSQPINFLQEIEPADRSGSAITASENIDGHFETGSTLRM